MAIPSRATRDPLASTSQDTDTKTWVLANLAGEATLGIADFAKLNTPSTAHKRSEVSCTLVATATTMTVSMKVFSLLKKWKKTLSSHSTQRKKDHRL